MKQIKLLLFVALSTVFASCGIDEGKDNMEPSDNLEQFGILGTWKLGTRDFGGISNLAVIIGYNLEFKKDSISTDLKGFFNVTQPAYEANGIFELDTLNKTIKLNFDNKEKLYEIQILETSMVLKYVEDNVAITEWWIKQE